MVNVFINNMIHFIADCIKYTLLYNVMDDQILIIKIDTSANRIQLLSRERFDMSLLHTVVSLRVYISEEFVLNVWRKLDILL